MATVDPTQRADGLQAFLDNTSHRFFRREATLERDNANAEAQRNIVNAALVIEDPTERITTLNALGEDPTYAPQYARIAAGVTAAHIERDDEAFAVVLSAPSWNPTS